MGSPRTLPQMAVLQEWAGKVPNQAQGHSGEAQTAPRQSCLYVMSLAVCSARPQTRPLPTPKAKWSESEGMWSWPGVATEPHNCLGRFLGKRKFMGYKGGLG